MTREFESKCVCESVFMCVCVCVCVRGEVLPLEKKSRNSSRQRIHAAPIACVWI